MEKLKKQYRQLAEGWRSLGGVRVFVARMN